MNMTSGCEVAQPRRGLRDSSNAFRILCSASARHPHLNFQPWRPLTFLRCKIALFHCTTECTTTPSPCFNCLCPSTATPISHLITAHRFTHTAASSPPTYQRYIHPSSRALPSPYPPCPYVVPPPPRPSYAPLPHPSCNSITPPSATPSLDPSDPSHRRCATDDARCLSMTHVAPVPASRRASDGRPSFSGLGGAPIASD